MSIQKKSLISTLKSAKKANLTKNEITFDHAHNSVKAQPVLKLARKDSPVAKASLKANLTAKAVAKVALATKTAVKS